MICCLCYFMSKKILFLFPNTANHPAISNAIPIFNGIAKELGWEREYFDTTWYQKGRDAHEDKEITGGFRPGFTKMDRKFAPTSQLVVDFQNVVDEFSPDILAITAMSCDFDLLMKFFPEIKLPSNTITIIGGVHETFETAQVIKTNLFDLVSVGQGEAVFREILTKYEQGLGLTDIANTYFVDRKSGNVTENPRRRMLSAEQIWQTDEDYSFYDDSYFTFPFDGKIAKIMNLEISRGCPFNCTYCGNTALKKFNAGLGIFLYSRDVESGFRLMKKMIDKFNIDIFNLTDECFLARPKDWLKKFAERYALEIKKSFLIQTRPETVTEENIAILKSFGAPFFQVGMGVESGSPKILSTICNRLMKVDEIIRAYDLLNKHGIRSNAYFMVGFPHETREDIFMTIDLCRRINSDINSVAIVQPLPGTELREQCLREGLITGNEGSATFTSGSILKMPQISSEEIYNLHRTFLLYAKLPKSYYPQIEKCEKDYENNKDLFTELVNLRWKIEDEKKKFQTN